MICVVAGTFAEYRRWCDQQGLPIWSRHALYVVNAQSLQGLRAVEVVCVGSWRERADLEALRTELWCIGADDLPV